MLVASWSAVRHAAYDSVVWRAMAMCVAVASVAGTLTGATADEACSPSVKQHPTTQAAEGASSAVGEYWEFICETAKATDPPSSDELCDWWCEKLNECGTRSLAICCREGAEPLVNLFVEKFGKEKNAVVDTLLLFGFTGFIDVEDDHILDQEELRNLPPPRRVQRETLFEWSNAIARAQVIRFCQDSAFFDRYYRACMWAGTPFGLRKSHLNFVIEYERLCNYFPKHSTPEEPYYWWHSRQFMFMAKATNQEMVFERTEPEKLFACFVNWQKRLGPHIHYLLPDPDRPVWVIAPPEVVLKRSWSTQEYTVPDGPYAEWNAKIPPPSREFSSILHLSLYRIPKECRGIFPLCDEEKESERLKGEKEKRAR